MVEATTTLGTPNIRGTRGLCFGDGSGGGQPHRSSQKMIVTSAEVKTRKSEARRVTLDVERSAGPGNHCDRDRR